MGQQELFVCTNPVMMEILRGLLMVGIGLIFFVLATAPRTCPKHHCEPKWCKDKHNVPFCTVHVCPADQCRNKHSRNK